MDLLQSKNPQGTSHCGFITPTAPGAPGPGAAHAWFAARRTRTFPLDQHRRSQQALPPSNRRAFILKSGNVTDPTKAGTGGDRVSRCRLLPYSERWIPRVSKWRSSRIKSNDAAVTPWWSIWALWVHPCSSLICPGARWLRLLASASMHSLRPGIEVEPSRP